MCGHSIGAMHRFWFAHDSVASYRVLVDVAVSECDFCALMYVGASTLYTQNTQGSVQPQDDFFTMSGVRANVRHARTSTQAKRDLAAIRDLSREEH